MSLSTPVRANIWHKRLGHPNGHVMAKVKIIAGRGVIFSDTLSACDTCKTKKSTKQKHPKASRLDPSVYRSTNGRFGGARNRSPRLRFGARLRFYERLSEHGISSLEASDTAATGNVPFHMRLRLSTSQARASSSAAPTIPRFSETAIRGCPAVQLGCRNGQNKPSGIYFGTRHVRTSYDFTTGGRTGSSHARGSNSLDDHEVANLVPSTKVPLGAASSLERGGKFG